jgi:hypothetical protein
MRARHWQLRTADASNFASSTRKTAPGVSFLLPWLRCLCFLYCRAWTFFQVLAAGDCLDDPDFWRFHRPWPAGKYFPLCPPYIDLALPAYVGRYD